MSEILVERSENHNLKDARLYITQFSRMEELLETVANATIQGMFGEKSEKQNAMRETLRILTFEKDLEQDVTMRGVSEECQELDELREEYMTFVSDYERYLNSKCKEVSAFIIENHKLLKELIQDSEKSLSDLESIKLRYIKKDPKLVETEYNTRVLSLMEKFENDVKYVKSKLFESQIERSGITIIGKELQAKFLSLYKSVPNKELLHLKNCYEKDVYDIEKRVSNMFEEQLQNWSESLMI